MISDPAGSPRIALVVDNPARDLPGLALVAWRLCQRGARCFLVPMNLQVAEIASIAPDFVLMNYLRRNNERSVQMYLDAGILVGVLDTEGGVFSPMVNVDARSRGSEAGPVRSASVWEKFEHTIARSPEVRGRVECYCCWTPEFASHFSRTGQYRSDQMVVTGTPRVDFYAPPWRQAARRIATRAAQYSGAILLINGGFPLANPRFQTPERELEQLIEEFSFERRFAEEWQRTQAQALHGLARLANSLARRLPEVSVVYRPHPFEGREIYWDLLERRPNLQVEARGTVDGWLLSARAMIHWGSSTALEASLAEIPAFEPGWLPAHAPVPTSDAVSISAPSEDALVRDLRAVLQGRFAVPSDVDARRQSALAGAFHRVDGRAHERVGESILGSIARRAEPPSPVGLQRLRSLARPSSPEWKSRARDWEASEKYFGPDAVDSMIAAIAGSASGPVRGVRVSSGGDAAADPASPPIGRSVGLLLDEAPRRARPAPLSPPPSGMRDLDARDAPPEGSPWVLGQRAHAAGRLEDAARHYRVALRSSPNEPELWIACGRLSIELGELDTARTALLHALSLEPRSAEAAAALGEIERIAGEKDTEAARA
ncbi:MAG: surface carbohydrate biosynthesis protein [Myxococcota bacterium]